MDGAMCRRPQWASPADGTRHTVLNLTASVRGAIVAGPLLAPVPAAKSPVLVGCSLLRERVYALSVIVRCAGTVRWACKAHAAKPHEGPAQGGPAKLAASRPR